MVQNGYVLTFDGSKKAGSYLYFSADELLKGFMLHIGLHMTDELNMENIDDFILASTNWNENEKCIKEIERLNAVIKSLSYNRMIIVNKLITERNRLLWLINEITQLSKKFNGIKDVRDAMLGTIKNLTKLHPYTLSDFRFKVCDTNTEECEEDGE